jgi:hypothetical protein
MKKKNDMARECAERLKPFGKTIKDATDFYLQHLTARKSAGRPDDSSPLAGALDWSDIRKRVAGDPFKTAVLDLFEMALRQRPAKPVFASLPSQTTDEVRTQRQAEQAHITSEDEMQQHRQKRDATATAYERFLEHNPVPDDLEKDERKQEIKERFAKFLLTPAGKFTDAMASDIFEQLDVRDLDDQPLKKNKKGKYEVRPGQRLKVAKRIFPSKDDAMEAIHRFAKQLKFELRKQH